MTAQSSFEIGSPVNACMLKIYFLTLRLGHRPAQFCSYSGSKFPRDRNDLSEFDKALPSWSLRDYIIPPAVLLVFGAGVWLIHSNDERRATSGFFFLTYYDIYMLLDSHVLLHFFFPDVGPEEVQKMAEAIDILEGQHHLKITPVYISIDPQRDSPAQLRAYLQEFHPKIIGLTGPAAAIKQIAQEFRIFFKKSEEEGQDYLIESTNDMILLNPKTEIVGRFGVRYDAVQLSDAVAKEVKKAAG
ncbi:unnamed protein product [Spirodela intermedia]|uniref:Uncharacterized protein n=1 Tax=Spirodela intermedia TaxID=51605 RepID=A0A7I8ILV9_SPIIN|nr:unnamed protein product [Spirodela intermedia]CAA6658818.1 unnamed protein product [Spirodela intermedia]